MCKSIIYFTHVGLLFKTRGGSVKQMECLIDSRETKLLEILRTDIQRTCLPLGDILFRKSPDEVLIERKTWADLWSSIRDGRFREQRSRLLEWCAGDSESNDEKPMHRPVYLIEGDTASFYPPEALETCRRALHRLMIAYRIPVIFTAGLQDTVEWIRWFLGKKDLAVFLRTSDPTRERIENTRPKISRSSIQSPRSMLLIFLRSIHGVSYPMAASITEKFGSISALIHAEHLEEILPKITYETPSKKIRKIGPKTAEKIFKLLREEEAHSPPRLDDNEKEASPQDIENED